MLRSECDVTNSTAFFWSMIGASSKRFLLLLIMLLLGPTGCATGMAKEKLITTNKLEFDSVESYAVRGKHVSAVCTTARYNSKKLRKYTIRIPAGHWSNQCLRKSGSEEEPCQNYIPISYVHSSDVIRGCDMIPNSNEYKVSVDSSNGGYLLISDAETSGRLMYVYHNTVEKRQSPWLLFMLPVAVLIDVATFPLQAVAIVFIINSGY